jgi:hypothetical protein
MITLSGLKPVLSKKWPSKNDEISIIVTGLRLVKSYMKNCHTIQNY